MVKNDNSRLREINRNAAGVGDPDDQKLVACRLQLHLDSEASHLAVELLGALRRSNNVVVAWAMRAVAAPYQASN